MNTLEYSELVRAQVGDAYVLGYEVSPENPDPHTFDCSELVEWSYARAGVRISDGAYLQYDQTKPFTGAARIGDLVFLRNNPDRPNGIGHVGIVVEVGATDATTKIVEAKGRAYGVIETTLAVWKAKSTYAGIRRHDGFSQTVKERSDVSVNYVYEVLIRREAIAKEAELVKLAKELQLQLVRVDPDSGKRVALNGKIS